MKLLLIRHAESEHNVQGLLAGVTDSALTNHGVIQTQKLGQHFAKNNFNIATIFTSDLQRARITAQAVRDEQISNTCDGQVRPPDIVILHTLREQNFGSHELKRWTSKTPISENEKASVEPTNSSFQEKESHESMTARCNMFLDDHLLPILDAFLYDETCVLVVSHGLILATLWKCLLLRFMRRTITLGPETGTVAGLRPLEHLPSWSNTGYLELEVKPGVHPSETEQEFSQGPSTETTARDLSLWRMTVLRVNCIEHLKNLKRTRGGLGSATYDSRQQRLEGFFAKKPRLKDGAV